MGNVEKKLVQDFKNWRKERDRNLTTKDVIEKDFADFMHTRFQITPSQNANEEPMSILDILDMMIAPDVDASLAANSVRENVFACKSSTQNIEEHSSNTEPQTQPCPDQFSNEVSSDKKLDKCFYVSSDKANQDNAVKACQDMGAELAKIINQDENTFVWSTLMARQGIESLEGAWIGLKATENEQKFSWQDGTVAWEGESDTGSGPDGGYTNWYNGEPDYEGSNGNCVEVIGGYQSLGKWSDKDCTEEKVYACSTEIEAPVTDDSSKTVQNLLQMRPCLQPRQYNSTTQDMLSNLPGIDTFLNPARQQEKEKIIEEKKNMAKTYFKESQPSTQSCSASCGSQH